MHWLPTFYFFNFYNFPYHIKAPWWCARFAQLKKDEVGKREKNATWYAMSEASSVEV